jgi:hypothetical protein
MPKAKSCTKKSPKRVLALPDLEHAKAAVLNSLRSASERAIGIPVESPARKRQPAPGRIVPRAPAGVC